jgi:hypothetical protein
MRRHRSAVFTAAALTLGGILSALACPAPGLAQQVDTIFAGHPTFTPVPFTDTIDVVRIRAGTRTPMGRVVTEAGSVAGQGFTIRSATAGVVYTTTVDPATFAPRSSRTRAATDSAELRFENGRIVGWAVPESGVRRTIDYPVTPGRSPVLGSDALLRILPYHEHYTALVRTFDAFAANESWRRFRVTGTDTASFRGRVTRAWVVEEATDEGQPVRRYWIARAGGQMIKALSLRHLRADGADIWWFAR